MPKAAKPKRTALIDESGDMGRKPDSSKLFTMSALITDNPYGLVEIVDSHPKNTKWNKYEGELKFSNSVDEIRFGVLDDIASKEPNIRAVVLDKKDIPEGHDDGMVYRDTARELIRDVLETTHGDVRIVMDYHDTIKNGRGERMALKVAEDMERTNEVTAKVARSKKTKVLQAADMVAGSVGQEYNKDNNTFHNVIRKNTTVRRIKLKR
jgi:hypothetical protein